MSKIPDWAMEMAKDIFSNMDSPNMDYRDTVSSIKTARLDDLDTIALALVAAEKRGIERALTVAKEYVWDEHALDQATQLGKAVHHQSVEIAAAIRQLGDEE